MIGIPGQTLESLLASVDGLVACGISHLSVYLLELEKAPRLVSLKKERPELFPDDDEMADRWEAVDDRLTAAGLAALRAFELGAAGIREPPQPQVLAADACPRVRRRGALVRRENAVSEHGDADRVPEAHAGGRVAGRDAPKRTRKIFLEGKRG